MHITKIVKREDRLDVEKKTKRGWLVKLLSMMKPFKFLSLTILIILPIVATPTWCIKLDLVDQNCSPEIYINSGMPKLKP